MAEAGPSVATLFDQLAGSYDNVGVEFFGPIAASLVDALAPRVGETWWDIGCGTGAVLEAVVPRIGPSARVVATDISPGMVERVRGRVAAAGWENVVVEVDDAQSPRSDLGPVDAISSCLVLFFLNDPPAALAQWHGLLRPAGRLGVTTFGRLDERWQLVDDAFTPYLRQGMVDARTTGAAGPFASDAGMAELVAGAGFIDVTTVHDAIDVRFASAEQWHEFTWSVGQRSMWLSIPEDQRPRVRAEAEEILAGFAAADGSITFCQAIRHTVARRG